MERLAIIIPTRNRAELLGRAIRSCVTTSCSWIHEIVVVDDGSTDHTSQVLAECSKNVPHLKCLRQSQAGANQARNRGAAASTAEVLLFLDSDDELIPEGLTSLQGAFASADVAVVCSPGVHLDEDGSERKVDRPRQLGPAYESQRGLFLAGSFAVRRDVFFDVGGFAEDCPSSQHTEFSLRLTPFCIQNGLRIENIDEPTVRIHEHTNGHLRGSLQKLLDGGLYIINNHRSQLQKSPKHYSDWCSVTGVYAAKARQFALARRLLFEATRWYPKKTTNVARLVLACCPPLARRVWRWTG